MQIAPKAAALFVLVLAFSDAAYAQLQHRTLLPSQIEAIPTPTPSYTWTLDALTQRALTYHPELAQAAQDVQVAQGNAVQAGLYPNPSVGTSSPQLNGTKGQNLLLTQEIVTANKLSLSRAAANRDVDQTRYRFQATRLRVIAGVRRQFFTTLVLQRRVELQTSLMEIVLRSRDTAKQLLDTGEGTKADIMLLDIQYDRSRLAVKNLQTELGVARRQLAFAVGLPSLPIDQVDGSLEIMVPEANLEMLRQYVTNNHPDMSVARVETGRTQFLLRRAQVQPIPNINAFIQNQGLFSVMVEVPLFDRNQGNIRAAQAQAARARAGVQTAELDLSQRTADAFSDFTVATQSVSVYTQQLRPKAQETFRITRDLYEQGQIDFLRLLQSQRTLIDTDLGYLDVQEARLLAATTLAALVQWEDFPYGSPPMPK